MNFYSLRRIVPVLAIVFLFVSFSPINAAELSDPFNRLIVIKRDIEQRHGKVFLQCFPFLKKIGDNQSQTEWVKRCAQGAQTLSEALKEVPDSGVKEFGISTRFLRTGGFYSLLVKWDASRDQMVEALKASAKAGEREKLFKKVDGFKRTILTNFAFSELYCTKTISNDECLKGYETLASVSPTDKLQKKKWGSVVISDTLTPGEDPTLLLLRHDQAADAMKDRLLNNKAQSFWDKRRKVYEEMDEKFGEAFRRKLQAPNVFCDPELNREECLQGAKTLHTLADKLADRPWGKIWINRHNTILYSDYESAIRFDIQPAEALKFFSNKVTRAEVESNVTKAEDFEKKLKNNSTGLRAVCDLRGIESKLCLQGFEQFVRFVKADREFKVPAPWETIMFIDGRQLGRVNFALNSSSRGSYLYFNPRSGFDGLSAFLKQTKNN